jgi:hypothetical protein
MSGDRKRNRGLASLTVAGLVGIFVVGCTAAVPAGKAQAASHPEVRDGRLVGDPYQAGGRSQGAQKPVTTWPGLTGTHPGGGGPQE